MQKQSMFVQTTLNNIRSGIIIENYPELERTLKGKKKKKTTNIFPRRPFSQLFIFNKLFLTKRVKK